MIPHLGFFIVLALLMVPFLGWTFPLLWFLLLVVLQVSGQCSP